MPSTEFAPLRFRDRSLSSFEARPGSTTSALAAARRFAAGEIDSLVLAGQTGVGKTHLAVAAAAERYDADLAAWLAEPIIDYEVRHTDAGEAVRSPLPPWIRPRRHGHRPEEPSWCSVPELIVGLRSDMDRARDDRAWGDRADELAHHRGIVILDDLGREKVSDWTGETIYTLVNTRYERVVPTIVTTNLTGAELAASPYWPVEAIPEPVLRPGFLRRLVAAVAAWWRG
jgi:hypothetical protein